MLALPQCEASLILYIPSADYRFFFFLVLVALMQYNRRLSAFDMAIDPVDVPVHVHKALVRNLSFLYSFQFLVVSGFLV
jgi:hypothetical protein